MSNSWVAWAPRKPSKRADSPDSESITWPLSANSKYAYVQGIVEGCPASVTSTSTTTATVAVCLSRDPASPTISDYNGTPAAASAAAVFSIESSTSTRWALIRPVKWFTA